MFPLQLTAGEVHSWCVRLDAPAETSVCVFATLSSDERSRAARFRYERDRRRFIVAHRVLRELLGRYLCADPGRIRFVLNAFGKPALGPEFGRRLRFNLSHSAERALIAVAPDADVGVDLERIRPEPDYAEVARRFFSAAELDYLGGLPSHLHVRAFLSCWTKKEAYVKARGEGLAMPLTDFSVPLTADRAQIAVEPSAHSNDAAPARRWSLQTLHPAPGYVGALAIEGTGWRVTQRSWPVSCDLA